MAKRAAQTASKEPPKPEEISEANVPPTTMPIPTHAAGSNQSADSLPTPSRFLLENGSFKFTPGLLTSSLTTIAEVNPFETSFQHQQQNSINHNSHSVSVAQVSSQPTVNNNTTTTASNMAANISEHRVLRKKQNDANPPSQQTKKPKLVKNDSTNSDNIIANPCVVGDSIVSDTASPLGSGTVTSTPTTSHVVDLQDHQFQQSEEAKFKTLAKNRMAASKCRQKKKQFIADLEEKAAIATKRNEELKVTISKLKEELMALKTNLLAHKDCNCNMIQKYLQSSGQFSYLINPQPSSANTTGSIMPRTVSPFMVNQQTLSSFNNITSGPSNLSQ